MKKKIAIILALSVLCCGLFAGCKEEKQTANRESYIISLNQTKAVLQVYDTLALTATVTDSTGNAVEAAISWESSDPAIAQVTEGVVIAKAEGQAEISAVLESGETAACKITVENTGIIPQVVVRNVTDGKLTIANGQSYHLASIVTFGGVDRTEADTAFAFRVADPGIATVSQDGVIQAVSQGTTQVIVTATWHGMGGDSLINGQDAYGLQTVIELTVTEA